MPDGTMYFMAIGFMVTFQLQFSVGPTSALLQEIQLITESLVKSESHLKKTIAKNMKVQYFINSNYDVYLSMAHYNWLIP